MFLDDGAGAINQSLSEAFGPEQEKYTSSPD
jgi:hypothetical protein